MSLIDTQRPSMMQPVVTPIRQPSRMALATRSLNAVRRLTGPQRADALRAHFVAFPPAVGSSDFCPLRK